MAVEATDGDFVPIALLGPDGADIAILRYELGAGGRAYEWVHIPRLRDELRCQMRQYKGAHPRWPGWEMDCLVLLIGLTGTDYSRGLPWVGPKKVWKMLPTLLPRAVGCFESLEEEREEERERRPNPQLAMDWLVAPLYLSVYEKHTRKGSFETVMAGLQRSRLSEKTKTRLPSAAQTLTTLRNCAFVLAYWRCHAPTQPPIDSMEGFGFRRDGRGRVEWDD